MGEVIHLNLRKGIGNGLAVSLGTLRHLTGMSPGEFAAAIADEAGEPVPASVYMAYEDGEPPPLAILSAARRVAARVPSQYGEGRTGALYGSDYFEDSVSGPAGHEDGDDVRRRDFLALTGATITAFDTLGKLSGPASGIARRAEACRDNGRVDAETCEGLSNLMLGYRQVYRSASAVSLLAPVCGTLNLLTELAPDSGRYRTTVVSLIGQAADLAGAILMFDLDNFAAAKHYLAIGARAAQQSADSELMAITLACRAFHAAYSGDAQAGVVFAQGALDIAARGIHPRSHGWVAAVASEMHATLGPAGEAACMAALETASIQLARPMPEQPWAGIGARVLLTTAGSRITTLAGLAGKKIAVNGTSSIGTVLISMLLAENGISPAKVRFVTDKQGFPDMPGPLQRGQWDAAFLAEPYATKAEEDYGQVELADLDQGATMNFPIGGYVATQAWARQHPQTAAAFVRAIEEGQALAQDNPNAARAAMGKSDQLPREVTAVISLPDFPVGPVNEQRMQRTADAMLQFGVLARHYAAEVRQGTLIRSMISPS